MYSQDPKVRRRRVKLRFFAYGIMTVATLVLATLGIFYVLGYRFDNSFEVQRGGLVKFDTRPQDSTITVDDVQTDVTPYQLNVAVGEHTVSYEHEGYQGWQKTVNVRPGEVLWLNYARLIPTSITTSAIKELSAIHQTSASPNREWYALHEGIDSPRFSLFDVRDETNVRNIELIIPAGIYTAQPNIPSTFEVISWDVDSRFLLVRHTSGAKIEYIRVPRDAPEDSFNITREFGLDLRSTQFAANTASVLFALDAEKTLYRLDVNDVKNRAVIAKNVSVFDNLDEARVAFVSSSLSPDDGNNRSLQIWQQSGSAITELRTVPTTGRVFVSYSPYLTHDYVSLVSENNISVIEDPLDTPAGTVLSDTMGFSATSLKSSPGSRFFSAQAGDQVYVYDTELARSYSFIAPGQDGAALQWADDHHVVATGGGNMRLVEFDGTNAQQITSIAGRHNIIIGADGEILLGIGRNSANKALELQQSLLLTEEDR